jgi:hypothetical protein
MLPFAVRVLRKLRKIVDKSNYREDGGMRHLVMIHREEASELIHDLLADDQPRMISRFGSVELSVVRRYYNRINAALPVRAWRFMMARSGPFWWDDDVREPISRNAGVFPNDDQTLDRFSQLYLDVFPEIDLLGSWRAGEWDLREELAHVKMVGLLDLEPFRNRRPWSRVLAGKRVLVVHPFVKSIQSQYDKRTLLFDDPELLPEFDLDLLPAVQSIGGSNGRFKDWFEALEYMKDEMASREFDVAIIGAGAYGMPLAAHAKRLGKKGVHLGGVTQLLFGIRGRRWDERTYYNWLVNEHWVRPAAEEKPKAADKVEGACYW